MRRRRWPVPVVISALILNLVLPLPVPPQPAQAAPGYAWYKTDLHVHSVVSADGHDDLGLIANAGKARGYNAMFVTDHQGASSFNIGTDTANNVTFDDTLSTRWKLDTSGSLSASDNTMSTAQHQTGSSSLHVKAASSSTGESFVYRERGPNLRSGTLSLSFWLRPVRVDAGSGVYVSVSLGGDPSIESPDGYETASNGLKAGRSSVFVWQLGTPRASSSNPDARVVTAQLSAPLNTWTHVTVDVTSAINAALAAADRPVDYNGTVFIKVAAAANNGTAEAYVDAFSLSAGSPVAPGDEFVHRNSSPVIGAYDTSTFKFFPAVEMGINRHAQRFNFGITSASEYNTFFGCDLQGAGCRQNGTDGIAPTQQTGYPSQLNHPGEPGGVSAAEATGNLAYGADVMEARDDTMISIWDDLLQTGMVLPGTWASDMHSLKTLDVVDRGVATYLYAPSLTFDELMQALFEGRAYVGRNTFAGRLVFNTEAASAEPYPVRYPTFVAPGQASAPVHLEIADGLTSGWKVRWIQNGSVLTTENVGGTSYAATKQISLSGTSTYVRAEVLDASNNRVAMTEPIFFKTVSTLPAGVTYRVDQVDTSDGRGYSRALTKGITSGSWNSAGATLTLSLENKPNSLVTALVGTSSFVPQAVQLDGGAVSTAGSIAEFDAATGSAYYFDAVNRVLHLKAKPAASLGSLVVSFGGSADTEDPTAPTGLNGTASTSTSADLSWNASTDNVGVTGYRIYRDGSLTGTVQGGTLTYHDTGLSPATAYTYRVTAVDAANNESLQSTAVSVTTPSSTILTVPVAADAYVDAGSPTSNFGSSTKLRVDASPTVQSFLRFTVSGVSGTVTSATLRIFATSSQSAGYDAHGSSASWTEGGVTYDTRPSMGSVVGSSGAASANTWTQSDVTALVAGNGTVDIAITTTSSTALALSSREGGPATAPQLVLDIASGGSGTAPANTALPTTSGSTQVGGSRSATTGTWTGSQPITYSYQWLRCDASGNACTDIGGATTNSYTIVIADLAKTLRARVTATNSIGSAIADSAASAVITQPAQADPVLAVAGDIACDPTDPSFNNGNGDATNCQQKAVSDLMIARDVDAVIPLGDNQYECGGYQALLQSYGPSWGRLFDISLPVIGNHDYTSSNPGTDCDPNGNGAGHWQYWGAKAGDPAEGYYSADVGTWHVVILNSNCSKSGGCEEGSAQQQWLATDLAAHTNTCTLAAFHHPRWSSVEKPNDPRYDALWRTLADAGADVVVVGHAHQYQRFTPMDASGQAAVDGMREFVVGTGGKHIHSGDFLPNENPTTLQTWNDNSFGALLLTLHPTSYDWEFAPIPGEPFTDSGSTTCSTGGGGPPPADIVPPSAPTNLRTTAVTSSAVDLAWNAATDNVGVTGYTIYRTDAEGLNVFSVGGSTLSYHDATVISAATYTYTVDAFDAAGNHSAESTAVTVTIPSGGPTTTTTLIATEDSYVDASKPTNNYGSSNKLRTDASPVVRSYLRFDLSGLSGTVTKATLRVWANSSQSAGWVAHPIADSWTELSLTYSNAPALGSAAGGSGTASAGTWSTADVTSLVTGLGTFDIGLTTSSSSALSLASRESGAGTAPQLVVETSAGSGDPQPPTIPGGVSATALSSSSIRVDWSASTDNVGVTSYTVYRGGAPVGTVNGSTLTFTNTGLSPSTLYSYTVEAFDAAANPSGQSSPPATATTQASDAQPPTIPSGVTATALSSSSIKVDWSASTDNVGVTSYTIYRGGSPTGTVSGSTLTFTDTGLSPSTPYSYTVEAFDAAANPSGQSSPPATATTQAGATSLTFTPTADSYVNASSPTTNYGTSTAIRVDGSPDVRTYLRFNVQIGTGTITRVTLRIFANTGSIAGLGARSVIGAWAETTLNYSNAPALGASNVGSSTPAVAGTWLTIDVTALVTGNGDIDIGVITAGTTAINLASRESANDPQLVVEFSP